jgi:MFS family permease
MALLGAASLAGGLAQEPALLIIARVAQGIATAMVTPAALSLMTTTFPEGPARSRALGLNGALMAAGFTAGAVSGGLLTGMLSWRWAFFINVIVAVLVLAAAPFTLIERPASRRARLDLPGTATVTAALVALVYGATMAGDAGWSAPAAWGSISVAAILLGSFWIIEHRVPNR